MGFHCLDISEKVLIITVYMCTICFDLKWRFILKRVTFSLSYIFGSKSLGKKYLIKFCMYLVFFCFNRISILLA